jgi:uncharacterized protein YdeI (YjbR/CyaY-like superfamily)
MSTDLPVLSFVDLPAWERWLKKHGDASSGIWMKLAKAGAPQPTLDKPKAIEGALCHGWIDGQIAKLDDHYFLVRFTRRRRGSRWSAVNRSSAQRLIEAGRMSEAGLRQIEAAKADGRWETAYASQSKAQVPRDLLDALAANPAARQKFSELDSANRFAVIYRVQDAKKADTRARRIAQYVEMLAHGKTLHPPNRPSRVGAKRGARRRIISPSSQ